MTNPEAWRMGWNKARTLMMDKEIEILESGSGAWHEIPTEVLENGSLLASYLEGYDRYMSFANEK